MVAGLVRYWKRIIVIILSPFPTLCFPCSSHYVCLSCSSLQTFLNTYLFDGYNHYIIFGILFRSFSVSWNPSAISSFSIAIRILSQVVRRCLRNFIALYIHSSAHPIANFLISHSHDRKSKAFICHIPFLYFSVNSAQSEPWTQRTTLHQC